MREGFGQARLMSCCVRAQCTQWSATICLLLQVEVKLRLPDRAAHERLAAALQADKRATYEQVGHALRRAN